MTTKRCNCPKCRLRYKDAALNRAAAKVRIRAGKYTGASKTVKTRAKAGQV